MEENQQTPHKRRVRYKGKYPKKFWSTWLMVAVADMLWRQLNNDDFAIF